MNFNLKAPITLFKVGDIVKQKSSKTGWYEIIAIENNKAIMSACKGPSRDVLDAFKLEFWAEQKGIEILARKPGMLLTRFQGRYIFPFVFTERV